jgi:hypothetical protein
MKELEKKVKQLEYEFNLIKLEIEKNYNTLGLQMRLEELKDLVEKLTIPVVVGQNEQLVCDTCKSGLINYPEINRRTCRCGRLGYNVTD